jgi:hypothetical protein
MSDSLITSAKSADDFYDAFVADMSKERDIVSKAAAVLTTKDLESLRTRLNRKKSISNTSARTGSPSGSPTVLVTVTEKALEQLWGEIERMDVSSLVDDQVIQDYEYKGFNANELLRTVLEKGLNAGRAMGDLQQDLINMVTIAVIKGSVTDKNLEKMSDQGKFSYKTLEDRYGLQKGGSQGKAANHVTIARIAAALPGVVLQVLKKKPILAKKFTGPFKTTGLPYYLRHQASAACIPNSLPDRTKNFLLGIITAYTSDQSKALSKTKDGPAELFERQLQFVTTTNGSEHPSEISRKKLFLEFTLTTDYEKLSAVGANIKRSVEGFEVPSQSQISEDMSKV